TRASAARRAARPTLRGTRRAGSARCAPDRGMRRLGRTDELDRSADGLVQHGSRQTSGLRVLLARVVASEQAERGPTRDETEPRLGAMAERRSGARQTLRIHTGRSPERGIPGDLPQREHHDELPEQLELPIEENGTAIHLLR